MVLCLSQSFGEVRAQRPSVVNLLAATGWGGGPHSVLTLTSQAGKAAPSRGRSAILPFTATAPDSLFGDSLARAALGMKSPATRLPAGGAARPPGWRCQRQETRESFQVTSQLSNSVLLHRPSPSRPPPHHSQPYRPLPCMRLLRPQRLDDGKRHEGRGRRAPLGKCMNTDSAPQASGVTQAAFVHVPAPTLPVRLTLTGMSLCPVPFMVRSFSYHLILTHHFPNLKFS